MSDAAADQDVHDGTGGYAGTPAAPEHTGVLADLARRREELRKEQVRTFKVPRWANPELRITCRPVAHEVLRRIGNIQEKAEREKNAKRQAQVELDTNADIIIDACVEVFAVMADGSEVGCGPNGDRTPIGPDLAASLGMPEHSTARAVCRQLFITDGDLLGTAKEIAEWSGFREGAIDSDLAGE